MRLRSLLIAFMIGVSFYSFAQIEDSARKQSVVPRHAVKFSPLHLLGFYPTVQVAYEFRVDGSFTFQLDGGYVFHNADTEYLNKRGFKAKLEPRYYFFQNVRRHLLLYTAFELYYNHAAFDRDQVVTLCFDDDCLDLYTQRFHRTTRYRERGGVVKFGMFKAWDRFILDVNSGLGLRVIDYQEPALPPSAFTVDDEGWGWEIPRIEDRTVPSLFFGFRMGYLIR